MKGRCKSITTLAINFINLLVVGSENSMYTKFAYCNNSELKYLVSYLRRLVFFFAKHSQHRILIILI